MFSKTYIEPKPEIGQDGSLITKDDMNTIVGEMGKLVTGFGNTLANDPAQTTQVYDSLVGHFAPINSPNLSGVPLTVNPDGTVANQIATVDYVDQKAMKAAVGFTPVQQGGGAAMGANKVFMGWASDASGVLIQIDASPMGKIVFQEENDETKGISQIGFNTQINQLGAAYDGIWAFYYSVADIDAKQFIQSTPDSSSSRITGIVWNTSSSFPQITYNDGQVAYSATTDWVNNKGYVSGTSSMGGGDTAATGIHYTPSSQTVQLNLADGTTKGIATQDWVNEKSYITTYSDGNTYPISEIGYNHASDNIGFATSNGFAIGATQSWTNNNYLAKSGGTMTGDIAINGQSIGQNSSGSKITFENGGHISIWDNSNNCNWYWSQSDGNQPAVYSSIPLIVNSYIRSNNPSSGENSNMVSTTSWVTNNFVANGTWDNNINQDVRSSSSPTFAAVNVKNGIGFNNGGTSSIYQDSNNGDVVIHTNNGSDHYNVFNADGSVSFLSGGDFNCNAVVSNSDIRVGTGNTLYTNTIGSYNGTTNVVATLQQQGQNVATENWKNSQGFATTNWVNSLGLATTNWTSSNFVGENTYNSDFATSDSRVFNAAWNTKIQAFNVGGVGERAFVTFPQTFGSIQAVIVQCIDDQDTNVHPYSLQNNGFYLHINGGGSCDISVIAFGGK
ncbi:hypothetical protein [Gluconobacter sp. DsW_056]|uniref:hypothetical protein n=1 Tax=Gluconobacter sp. DsW_056 TaxID=1511209 RepID=UPI00117A824A|nr:hypothetical protein [Gluconobacter sp. DsW_056]